MAPPQPPKLEITEAMDNTSYPSPTSGSPNIARRPSIGADTLFAGASPNTLHPSPNFLTSGSSTAGESSRSRSSSFAGASMLSGDTALPPPGTVALNMVSDEEALLPDPGTEDTFVVEDNKFAYTPGQLNKTINPKSLAAYGALGGLRALEKGLQTDLITGLGVDEGHLDRYVTMEEAKAAASRKIANVDGGEARRIASASSGPPPGDMQNFVDRKRVFKDNSLPQKTGKGLLRLMWEQYNDKILWLLTAAAVVSLSLGIYETVGTEHKPICNSEDPRDCDAPPPSIDWVEGVAICVAIVIVVLVGAANDWQKERQFVKLNAKKEDRSVKAIRSGRSIEISVYDVLVGDVLHLEPGDMIPADGIFIQGHNVKCDESSATGESDQMKKTPGAEVYRQIIDGTAHAKLDPFMISGSKVLEGAGTFLVTSTGVNSSFGRLMMSLHTEAEPTPLQVKLGKLADAIAYLGGGSALLLFAVLFFRFCAGLPTDIRSASEKGSAFLDILIVAITLVVVAIPEGLPLAVTLALAFATTRMLKEKNLVRVLRACETMGNATTVCSDKTGTLTQNKMTVVSGTISTRAKFNAGTDETSPKTVLGGFSDAVRYLLMQSIAINSTAFEGEEDGVPTYIGSKTETAMLTFARDHLGLRYLQSEREHADIVQMIPFDSGRKCMGAVVKLANGVHRLYVKGASEILLGQATRRVSKLSGPELTDTEMTAEDVAELENTINTYAERSLRTIGMLYKDYTHWPPIGAQMQLDDPNQVDFDDIFREMIFLGIVGIMDPLRDGVAEAVEQCRKAGVIVRMVTGDNVVTAKAIATECGIFTPGGIVMEGPAFRRLSEKEMDEVLPQLQVLARSSPEDKRILVQRLKQMGDIVAVTGDGTNDGPALKMADVGFSMGIAGTEVAKEASSIILMDDNFASIIKALMWGRAVNDAVQKFLQFQLTVNITAVLVTFVSAVASADGDPVLTAVQLLWVNLIMDTFAALALATDPPTPEILNRKPTPRSAGLVSLNMWKMIIGQAIYQLIVTFILHFGGKYIFPDSWTAEHLKTIVFNTFVWMQIFNEFNNRRLDNKFNIFEGIHRNFFFIGINCIMVGGQIMIIFVGSTAFSIRYRLTGEMWAVCLVLGALCLPWAVIVRCVPDAAVQSFWDASVRVFGPPTMACVGVFSSLGRAMGRKDKATPADVEAVEEKGKQVA